MTRTKHISVTKYPKQDGHTVKVVTISRTRTADHIETEAVIRYEKPPTLVQWLIRALGKEQ